MLHQRYVVVGSSSGDLKDVNSGAWKCEPNKVSGVDRRGNSFGRRIGWISAPPSSRNVVIDGVFHDALCSTSSKHVERPPREIERMAS